MAENLEKIVNSEIVGLEKDKLPATIAISERLEDYENKKVVLSFEPYNQSQCQLYKLEKPDTKKLTSELKNISQTTTKKLRYNYPKCKPVHNSNQYSILFNGLPKDAEVLEVDYSGPGRIFGFLVENIFNVIAIVKVHFR